MSQLSISPVAALATTTQASVYTVPTGYEVCLNMAVVNYNASTVALSAWLVPPGDTISDKHKVLDTYNITTKEPRRILDKEPLPAGTQIYVQASANTSIAVRFSGTTRSTVDAQ